VPLKDRLHVFAAPISVNATPHHWKSAPLVFALMGLVAVFLTVAVDGIHPVPMQAVITGTVAWQMPKPRHCDSTQETALQQRVQLDAPHGGWPGTPQAVNVSNVFAGEVMIAHGERHICGQIHNPRLRDARFGSGVGTLLFPPKGDLNPIIIAWNTPLKPHWVPTVHLGDPATVHEADILRLMVRVSCLAIALVLAFSAVLGWLGTRNRMFALHLAICLLLLAWQAILSGLNGYLQPWIPMGDNGWAWLIACSTLGSAAILGGVLIQAEIGSHWPHWQLLGRWMVRIFLGTAALVPWLPDTVLQQVSLIIDSLFAMSTVLILVLAVRAARHGYPRAWNIIAALFPQAAMMLAELFPCSFIIEYRIELTQLAITWCLSVMAWMLSHCYEQLRQQRDTMQYLADTDALTGLPNRRAGLAMLESAITSAHKAGAELTIGFVDIDWFKHINDHYGHAVGDLVLTTIAKTLISCTRHRHDVVRMGGDEFLFLLPGTEITMARRRMETLRHRISKAITALNIHGLGTSVSIGLASLGKNGDNSAALLASADSAMYHAKHTGRNQIAEAAHPLVAPGFSPATDNACSTLPSTLGQSGKSLHGSQT